METSSSSGKISESPNNKEADELLIVMADEIFGTSYEDIDFDLYFTGVQVINEMTFSKRTGILISLIKELCIFWKSPLTPQTKNDFAIAFKKGREILAPSFERGANRVFVAFASQIFFQMSTYSDPSFTVSGRSIKCRPSDEKSKKINEDFNELLEDASPIELKVEEEIKELLQQKSPIEFIDNIIETLPDVGPRSQIQFIRTRIVHAEKFTEEEFFRGIRRSLAFIEKAFQTRKIRKFFSNEHFLQEVGTPWTLFLVKYIELNFKINEEELDQSQKDIVLKIMEDFKKSIKDIPSKDGRETSGVSLEKLSSLAP